MNTQKSGPFLTLEEFLNKSMSSEIESQFAEFLNLWQSSESLKLLIKRFVLSNQLHSMDFETASTEQIRQTVEHEEASHQEKAAQILIAKGLASPFRIAEHLAQSYGRLNRKSLLVLLEKSKAGNRDLGVYMLIRACKRALAKEQAIDIRLKRIALDLISSAILNNRADFFEKIANTIEFFRQEEYRVQDQWNHDPGQWWQFHLLLYILENPKPMYPIREFVKYFKEEVGSHEMPTTKTIRKFCRRHGIALDSTPGAPRKAMPS